MSVIFNTMETERDNTFVTHIQRTIRTVSVMSKEAQLWGEKNNFEYL